MRVLMLSKACIVGTYQRKLEEIAALGVELLVMVPPTWRDERGETPLERVYTTGYRLETTPIRLNGNFHLHYYPQFGAALRDFKPDIVHIDEEPYNVATWHALYHAHQAKARSLFFSWQNIQRSYPLPFSLGERWALEHVDYALMGTQSAADVWRAKGYHGPLAVIPQFGVDPDLFHPTSRPTGKPFTIGYFGRLVPEKGLDTLLHALTEVSGDWRLTLVGGGPQQPALESLAGRLGIAERVEFMPLVPSMAMPARYATLDVLVLPSRTRPNWKEQFGRVLVEAMASGIPLIGSDSGAIPDVIGPAGLIFPEGDAHALAAHIQNLMDSPPLCKQLATQGRDRVLAYFTHQQVAQATVTVYQAMLA